MLKGPGGRRLLDFSWKETKLLVGCEALPSLRGSRDFQHLGEDEN